MIAVMIQTMKLNEINLEESEKNKRDSYVDASKSAFAPLFRSSVSFLVACLQRKVQSVCAVAQTKVVIIACMRRVVLYVWKLT